jgi:hypothetical protein
VVRSGLSLHLGKMSQRGVHCVTDGVPMYHSHGPFTEGWDPILLIFIFYIPHLMSFYLVCLRA